VLGEVETTRDPGTEVLTSAAPPETLKPRFQEEASETNTIGKNKFATIQNDKQTSQTNTIHHTNHNRYPSI
jgi:hypothetical protein